MKTIFGGVMYTVNNFAYDNSESSPIQSVDIFGTELFENLLGGPIESFSGQIRCPTRSFGPDRIRIKP